MRAYSMDLRDRVVSACDAGELTREEIAEEFGVSLRWIRQLLRRRRETGDYGPQGHGGGRSAAFDAPDLKRLERLVRQQPDATLAELRERMGVDCSLVTVHNTLKRLGYRRKKRPSGRLSKIVRT
jgi:transposase